MYGWVGMPRNIIQKPFFDNERMAKIWMWLACKSSFKEHEVLVGMKTVTLLPGQVLFGIKVAEAELKIPHTSLYRMLKSMEKQGVISIKAEHNYSVITLHNLGVLKPWAESKWDQEGIKTGTYNKDKKEKKDKNINNHSGKVQCAEFVFLTPEQEAQLKSQFGEEDAARLITMLNNHKGATGKVYRDDYYAILSWCVDTLNAEKSKTRPASGKVNRFINFTDTSEQNWAEIEKDALKRRRLQKP